MLALRSKSSRVEVQPGPLPVWARQIARQAALVSGVAVAFGAQSLVIGVAFLYAAAGIGGRTRQPADDPGE